MIVCHCEVVNDTAIKSAVDEGARTLAEVCRATGAGRDCGTCVFSVKAILCDHATTSVHRANLTEPVTAPARGARDEEYASAAS